MRQGWLTIATVLAICGAAVLVVHRTGLPRADKPPRADSLLNIPLERTAVAREEFVRDYRNTDPRHAAALYQAFLPRIGANGLREGIQKVFPLCHAEAHDLGKVIFAKLQDVGASLQSCADACTSGCMHGVLMEFFGASGSKEGSAHQHTQLTAADVGGRIPTFCESPEVTRMYRRGDCAHGVGHAVMFLSNYDIAAAIDLCERFPTHPLRYYCATGAYMEYVQTRSRTDYPAHGGLYPCEKAPYPAACFRYLMTNTTLQEYFRGGTLEKVDRQCAGLEGKYRLGCFHGIGFAHLEAVARGKATVADTCGFGSREDQAVCIEGVMERLGRLSATTAAERCEPLADWRSSVCRAAAAREMYDLDKSFALYER